MDTNDSHSSNLVYELVINNVPDLERLCYKPNEFSINGLNEYTQRFFYMLPDCELIAKFNNLKVLSYSGVTAEWLKILAQKNTVEKLKLVEFSFGDLNFMDNYTNLKSIRMYTYMYNYDRHTDLLLKMSYLREATLDFYRIDNAVDYVIKAAVESARNLSNLHISSRIGKFSIDMYSKLIEVRLRHGLLNNPLTIYMKNKPMKNYVFSLGQSYRPDIIIILS